MNKYIFAYLIYSLLLCCSPSNIEQSLEKEDQSVILGDSVFAKTSYFQMEILSDSGKVIIESLMTEEFLSDYHLKVEKPIIEEQKMIFVNPRGEKKLIYFNLTPIDSMKSLSGNSYILPEGIIVNSKAINTKSGVLYSFYGGDQMSANKEFFGITNAQGEWLWYYYGTAQETISEFGDYESFVNIFGQEVTNLDKMTRVIP